MRIVFLSDMFPPQLNGVATSIAHFARELGRRGHQVLIVCPAPPYRHRGAKEWHARNVRVLRLPAVPVVVYPDIMVSPLVGLPLCLAAIRRFNPDIVHLHTTLLISLDAVLVAKLLKKPLIGTNHNFITSEEYDFLSAFVSHTGVRKQVAKLLVTYFRMFYNACDACIAPSKLLVTALRKDGFKRVKYVPNGVPMPSIRTVSPKERERLRKRYKLASRVILHIGRLSSEKKVDVLITAMQKLDADCSLLIIGDGPHRKALEKLVKRLKLSRRVVFTGFLPNDILLHSGLLSIADVFATASTMESQGMVVVEAMAYGLPVVAADACAVPEVLGNAGILVRPGDPSAFAAAFRRVLSSAATAKKLSAQSKKRYAYFSMPRVTDMLLKVYKSQLNPRPPRRGGP